jgi:hypothetical protein
MCHERAQVRVHACTRTLACVRGRARIRANAREHFNAVAERRVPGSQALNSASVFNADIGAWNTARVTTLSNVCAASGPARTAADCARSVADACAAGVRGGAADVCARVRVHTRRCIRACCAGMSCFTCVFVCVLSA